MRQDPISGRTRSTAFLTQGPSDIQCAEAAARGSPPLPPRSTSRPTAMPSSDFLRDATVARLRPSMHRPRRRWTPRAQAGPGRRLYRLRLHGGQPTCGQPGADHDAATDAAPRPSPGRPDGRRHVQDRRPLLPRRGPRAAGRGADRHQHGRHPPPASSRSSGRRRCRRRAHAEQRQPGSTSSAISSCCARSGRISPSAACCPSTASAPDWSASRD